MIDNTAVLRINTSWMLPSTQCWVQVQPEEKSKLAFRKANILSLDKKREMARLTYPQEKGPEEVHCRYLLECNQSQNQSQQSTYDDSTKSFVDMIHMNVLNEAEILNNLDQRYAQDLIFTYIGPTLIVINPYKVIDRLFSNKILEDNKRIVISFSMSSTNSVNLKEYPAHIWAISASAYIQLFEKQKNQAIVISGESGAGKTENAKYSMKYLTSLSQNNLQQLLSQQQSQEQGENHLIKMNKQQQQTIIDQSQAANSIEEKILSCNPILEAFGNAKTLRNDNSSRFGKYVRIWIHRKSRKIQGASISNYLLEKSRVAYVAKGERNYHIFYHIIKGLSQLGQSCPAIVQALNKKTLDSFYYIKQGGCMDVESIKDAALFKVVLESLRAMNFNEDDKNAILRILIGILFLGNIEFDASTYTDNTPCSIKNMDVLQQCADILQLKGNGGSSDDLRKALVLKMIAVQKTIIESPVPGITECCVVRDSLAKALYDRLFNWLVIRLNLGIMPKVLDNAISEKECNSIGLLDIFGFENFEINSLEQLFINFTNEKLQQLYIGYVFKAEEQEMIEEGLKDKIKQIVYSDNQSTIDLIEKDKAPLGIFELLDESCSLGNATDDQLLKRILKEHAKHERLVQPKIIQDKFTIKHTAKDVEYNIINFRLKNKDEIGLSLLKCMEKVQNDQITKIWHHLDTQNDDNNISVNQSSFINSDEEKYNSNGGQLTQRNQIVGRKNKDRFLGAKFKMQIRDLMTELMTCDVHFVRCVKPNEIKQKGYIDQLFVLQQIRYLGILESIRVRKEGYPIRLIYVEFYSKYHELDQINKKIRLQRHLDMKQDMLGLTREMVQRLIMNEQKIDKKSILYGKSKIYMKQDVANNLDSRLMAWWKYKNEKATKLQKACKRFLVKKNIKQGLAEIHEVVRRFRVIQAKFKGHQQRIKYLKLKKINKAANALEQLNAKLRHQQKQKILRLIHAKIQARKKGKVWSRAIELIEKFMMQYHRKFRLRQWLAKSRAITQQIQKKRLMQQQEEYMKIQPNNQKRNQNQDESKSNQDEDDEEEKNLNSPNAVTDEFQNQGLRLWAGAIAGNGEQQQMPEEFNKKISIPEDMLNEPEKYISPEVITIQMAPMSKDDRRTLNDYCDDFLRRIRRRSFYEYCEEVVIRSKNFGKKVPITKIMSHQKNALDEPLTKCLEYYDQATLSFRCILKLSGNRRSRFPEIFHVANILKLCMGCLHKYYDPYEALVQKDENGGNGFGKGGTFNLNDNEKRRNGMGNNGAPAANMMLPQNGNLNPENVLEHLSKITRQNKLFKLRDECYLQLCKQMTGNTTQDSLQRLYKFMILMVNCIPPSESLIMPLLNFFFEKINVNNVSQNQNENGVNYQQTQQNIVGNGLDQRQSIEIQKDQNYIFNKLAKFAQAYAIIKDPHPLTISASTLHEAQIFKLDPIIERFAKTKEGYENAFDLFYYFISQLEQRKYLPDEEEIQWHHQRHELQVKIYVFSQQFLWVPVDSFYTVKQTRDQIVRRLDMMIRAQYFALFEVKYVDGKIVDEKFLNDTTKILDLIRTQRCITEYKKNTSHEKVDFKIYLRLRVYYKLFKKDIDSVNMFFMQCSYDVSRELLPISNDQMVQLLALMLYSKLGQYQQNQGQQKKQPIEGILIQEIKGLLSKQRLDEISLEHWLKKAMEIYPKLQFQSRTAARFEYMNILRPCNLFLSYQFDARIFQVDNTKTGYQKKQSPVDCILAVRPQQVIIAQPDNKKVIKIIHFTEMTQWGQALGQPPYFFIKLISDELMVFSLTNIQTIDYLINAYVNWKLSKPVDEQFCASFNDVLSFFINNQSDGI